MPSSSSPPHDDSSPSPPSSSEPTTGTTTQHNHPDEVSTLRIQTPGKRPRSEVLHAASSVNISQEEVASAPEASSPEVLPPPPPVRRSSSLLSNAVDTSAANAPSLSAFGKPLLRRRSSLFDSLPGRSRAAGSLLGGGVPETQASPPSSFFQRFSQNSTLLGDDLPTNLPDDSDDNENETSVSQFQNTTTATAKRPFQPRGSLFGAVMEKLKVTPGTPQRNQPPAAQQHQPQPQQNNKPAGFMSPSGKSIMNMVNQFVMSPFRFSSPNRAKRRLLSSPAASRDSAAATLSTPPPRKRPRKDSTASATATLATPSPRGGKRNAVASHHEDSMSSLHDDDNWREAPVHGGQAEILDWTLSSSSTRTKCWQLECHPPAAIGVIVQTREWRDTLGYWEYAPPTDVRILTSTSSSSSSKGIEPKAKGGGTIQKSLTERVASAAAVATKGIEKNGTLDSGDTNNAKDPAVELATRLVRSVRVPSSSSSRGKPNAGNSSNANASRPALVVTDGKRISNDTDDVTSSSSSFQQQQTIIREWKQSFRSLYMDWCQRVEAEENMLTAILDYYFYCVSADHVVLFRVDATKDHFTPRVLISSCGESFLQLLRETGVDNMKVLKDPIVHSDAAKGNEKDDEQQKRKAMSPTVKADLEALRRAQAYGEVAGADVSIKIKMKTNGNIKPTTHQPKDLAITVSGYDDVATFFEVYMNRLGRVKNEIKINGDDINNTTTTLPHRLPKLISPREMGPFWHASLKSLETRPVKPSKGAQGTTMSGIVEIQGSVVLPSMIRRLIALSASKLALLHSKSSGGTDTAPLQIRSPSREDPAAAAKAGSHYVVLHAVVEEDESILKTSKTLSRMAESSKKGIDRASVLFNDIDTGLLCEEKVQSSDKKLPECRSGTTIQLLVWDVSRSNVAACKVGAISH